MRSSLVMSQSVCQTARVRKSSLVLPQRVRDCTAMRRHRRSASSGSARSPASATPSGAHSTRRKTDTGVDLGAATVPVPAATAAELDDDPAGRRRADAWVDAERRRVPAPATR